MKDWLVERVLLDEVPASCRDQVAAARGTGELDDALAILRESNDEILAALPPAAIAAEVERRARAHRAERSRRWVMWVAPMAAAAAILMVVVLRGGSQQPVPETGVRSKGDARLEIYRKVGTEAVRIRPGVLVAEGDRLQLSYVAAGVPYGVIVSIDGRGEVTVHHPAGGSTAAPLETDGKHALPFAYELDDAPGYERFWLVTSRVPFDVDIVVRAARALVEDDRPADTAALTLPSMLTQVSYVYYKQGFAPQ